VDYAQLMRWPERADGEPAALSLGTRTLGAFAGRDKVALLLLVQLNRDLEKREDKRPRLSDMKGSGEFEQHARLVLMVYHEAAHVDVGKIADPEERAAMQSKLEIAVRKNHDGQNNKVAVVHWDQPRHRVVDAAWDDVPRATTPTNGARSQATFRLGDDPPPPTDDDVPF
jgi:replicative DNA helicase